MLAERLAREVAASDLQSLMLEVYRQRAGSTAAPDLLAQAGRNLLFEPSSVDARTFASFDRGAFEAASEFEASDLAPACPFGASQVLGGQSQNNILTTIRNAESLGDSTIAMAIEAARRRKRKNEVVRMCASHRVTRLQPLDIPGLTPHFRLFAMITAGRDTGSSRFEVEHLREHIRVYLRMLRLLNEAGWRAKNPVVELTDMVAAEAALQAAGVTQEEVRASVRAHWFGGSERFLKERGIQVTAGADSLLEKEVIAPLAAEFPEASLRVNPSRLEGYGYYRRYAMRIAPEAPDGVRYPVADGGFTDWTARLMGNRKERLMISGIGSELFCKKYR